VSPTIYIYTGIFQTTTPIPLRLQHFSPGITKPWRSTNHRGLSLCWTTTSHIPCIRVGTWGRAAGGVVTSLRQTLPGGKWPIYRWFTWVCLLKMVDLSMANCECHKQMVAAKTDYSNGIPMVWPYDDPESYLSSLWGWQHPSELQMIRAPGHIFNWCKWLNMPEQWFHLMANI